MKKFLISTLSAVTLCTNTALFAETITLKSGREIEGSVLKQNDASIAIDVGGVALTYYREEIEKISDKPEAGVSTSTAQAARQQGSGAKRPEPVRMGIHTDHLRDDGEEIRIDIYDPGGQGIPAVIVLHGSAGIEGERAQRYRDLGSNFMNSGIMAINVHYFNNKTGNYLSTISKAIDHVSAFTNVNKHKIGLLGYSAGGTLALSVAARDKRVALLALQAGFLPMGFTQIDASYLPKTFMLSGSKDQAIDTLNALRAWFDELNKPYEVKINEGCGHDNIPMSIFQADERAVIRFFADNF